MAFFRTLASIVAAGVFFVTLPGVGQLLGLGVLNAGLVTALRVGAVILTAAAGAAGRVRDRQEISVSTTLTPGTPLPVVYGRARVGSVVADWFVDPDTQDKVLYMILALAHGARDGLGIAAIEEIWLDNKRAVRVAGDERFAPYGPATVGYAAFLGTTTQNVGNTVLGDLGVNVAPKSPAQVTDSGWNATTDLGAGIVALSMRFLNLTGFANIDNPEAGRAPAFRGPPNVSAILVGRVYDTRTATWVAGGDNNAMCTRDFLLSPIYGCGRRISVDLLHEESFREVADYCDELVEYQPGVPQKRYTCNGFVDTSQPTEETLKELLSSFGGSLVWEQGKLKLVVRRASAPPPLVTLTPANLVGQWSFRNAGIEEKWNLVTASYIDPLNGEFKARETQWPRAGEANAYLAADGGFLNRLELNLPFTHDQLVAQAIAQVTLNESRQGISAEVLGTEELLQLSVGDRVKMAHPTPGWMEKEFWVGPLALAPDTTVAVTLQEFDPAAYSLDTLDDRDVFPETTLDSITNVPAPGSVVVDSGTDHDLIRISWMSAEYGLIDFYEVQVRHVDGDNTYRTVARVRGIASIREASAGGVRNGQTWQARVRVVNIAGHASNWTESATHVVQIHDVPSVALTLTTVATGVEITVSDFDLDGDGIDAFRVELYVRENAGAAGPNPLETEAYHLGTSRLGDGPVLEPAADGQFIRAFGVPYNRFGERGLVTPVAEAQSGSAGGGPFGPPTGLACANCAAGVSNLPTQIDIVWVDGDPTSQYRVSLDGQVVATVAAGVQAYSFMGLASDHLYVVGVQALENGTFNPLDGPVTISVRTLKGTLGVPQNLTSQSLSIAKVKLTWTAGTDGTGASYVIERSPNGSTGWVQIGTTGAGVLQFEHEAIGQGEIEWFFRVKAQRTNWNDSPFTVAVAGTYGADDRVARSVATTSAGVYTSGPVVGAELHTMVDESAPDDDTTYVQRMEQVDVTRTFEVRLRDLGAAYDEDRAVMVRVRARRLLALSPANWTLTQSFKLMDGAAEIAASGNLVLTNAYAVQELVLTPAQRAALTGSTDDLRVLVQGVFDAGSGINSIRHRVTHIELENDD